MVNYLNIDKIVKYEDQCDKNQNNLNSKLKSDNIDPVLNQKINTDLNSKSYYESNKKST